MLIVIVKLILFYFLWGMPFRPVQNIICTGFIVVLYELYLRANGHNIVELYKNEIANIMKGNTPLIHTILTFLNK
jgi:hypothetical protein